MNLPQPLTYDRVRYQCDLTSLGLESSQDVQAAPSMIGQRLALDALKTGLTINSPGFNIYITGPRGSGRFVAVREILRQGQIQCPLARSYTYVHNFEESDQPILITLPRGMGKEFAKAIDSLRDALKEEVPALLGGDVMSNARRRLMEKYARETRTLFGSFEKKVTEKGFALAKGQTATGTIHIADIVPVLDGEAVPLEQLREGVVEHSIPKEDLAGLEKTQKSLRGDLEKIVGSHRKLSEKYRRLLMDSEKRKVGEALEPLFAGIIERFSKIDNDLEPWLMGMKKELLDNLPIFREGQEESEQKSEPQPSMDAFLWFVRANLLWDPIAETEPQTPASCPVIEEAFPTWRNLFGGIEGSNDPPIPTFMDICAGSMLRADGGFLVLYAQDVISEPRVYETLKRILRKGEIEIANRDEGQTSALSLKPTPLPINVKVILVGDDRMYTVLRRLDHDFSTIFKVKVELEEDMPLTPETLADFTTVLKRIITENGLPVFSRGAMESLVEEAVRLAGTRRLLSTKFSQLADAMREAAHLSLARGAPVVEREDQDAAIANRLARHGQKERHMLEMIRDGKLLIDVDGLQVGQINGLGYYSVGDAEFGLPARISATCCPGRAGLVNIEREADLSGSIHDKGILLVSGFLAARFGQDKPLSLQANLAFEQSYGAVDGDSASMAELLALLSALSSIPLRQDFAVTGSMNQRGQVQPVGGVSEKVMGFYRTCMMRGFTGNQGVIMPIQNVDELHLDHEATTAVKEGRFHVLGVDTVEQALAHMTGKDPTKVLAAADATLSRYWSIVRDFR
ncbi:MAG TPA: AAA family ATPase [Planctomycetota bacterium]|nr:AAA family ATPase [Planctomycetota bacterium]